MHCVFLPRVPYNNHLIYLACSNRTGQYWPSVVFVRSRCARSELPRPLANIPQNGYHFQLVRGKYQIYFRVGIHTIINVFLFLIWMMALQFYRNVAPLRTVGKVWKTLNAALKSLFCQRQGLWSSFVTFPSGEFAYLYYAMIVFLVTLFWLPLLLECLNKQSVPELQAVLECLGSQWHREIPAGWTTNK